MDRLHLTRNLRTLAFLLTIVVALAGIFGLWWVNHTGLPESWRNTIEREVAKQGADVLLPTYYHHTTTAHFHQSHRQPVRITQLIRLGLAN